MLRYFYEERPDIAVIAVGSWLEFALRSKDFSFPVGRVEFYHLGPMSFREFLWATGDEYLDEKLGRFEFSHGIHTSAVEALKTTILLVGCQRPLKTLPRKVSER